MTPQPAYEALEQNLDSLLASLNSHPRLSHNDKDEPVPNQAGSNKIFFMWDFVRRSRELLGRIDPSLPASQKQQWSEVVQRCAYSSMLIRDTSGKLAKLMKEPPGQEVDFGDAVKEEAKDLVPATALVGTVTGTA